ncbi:MAG: DUF192 domain-containing protein [Halobacteriaceae archaeon]
MTTHDLHDQFETVEVADSFLARVRGVMFRDLPESYVLVHEWDRVAERATHTFGSSDPIDAYWVVDDVVVAHEWLVQWGGSATHEGDTLLQTRGGPDIAVGDRITY